LLTRAIQGPALLHQIRCIALRKFYEETDSRQILLSFASQFEKVQPDLPFSR